MTGESRPVCVYAMAGLKRNTTKLLVTMCIGIAIAMYGVYVQARSHSNPSYMPSISMASHWIYNKVGNKLAHPTSMLPGCQGKQSTFKQTFPNTIMQIIIKPLVHYSGVINGMINLAQIILLKVHPRSIKGTNMIIALSALGWTISMICLGCSYATCKLMCISCLGIHHILIIYFAYRRRKIIQNMLCPPENTNEGSCSYGSGSSGGGGTTGKIFGTSASASTSTNTTTTPTAASISAPNVRRRGPRI